VNSFCTGIIGAQKEKKKRENYSAAIVGTGGSIGARSVDINIYLDRHTTDEEVKEYLTLLEEKGTDQLRRKLEKVAVGRIAPVGAVGVDLAIARVFETPEGKVIRVMAARPMSFLELRNAGRSTDYPYTAIELRLNKEGKGDGSVVGGAKVSFDKEGRLEIESFGNQYAKVVNVRTWN
jgi:hypothetical protein